MESALTILGGWWRKAYWFTQKMAVRAVMYMAALVSFLRWRKSFIEETHQGEQDIQKARKVAVFAHYDRRGRVDDYVVHHLRSLRAAGFHIVFISNAPRWDPSPLLPLCSLVVRRKNIGYDFGAYKDALSLLGDVSALDQLILANDSVYGPFNDLGNILKACDHRAELWGITDSWSVRYHLQSYFLLFDKVALRSTVMREFWRSVRYVQSKNWVIVKYEIGLTQALLRSGLRCEALCPYRVATGALTEAVVGHGLLKRDDIPDSHTRYVRHIFGLIEQGIPLNSMHHFWDHLITKMGCPFIKRELLTKNPEGVPYVSRWPEVIRSVSDYDTSLIVQHLQRGSRDRIF